MGRYHQAREQLKAMVEQTVRADLAPARDEHERERLEQMVNSRSEQLLDNFEAKRLGEVEHFGAGIAGYTREGAPKVAPELFTGKLAIDKAMLAKLTLEQKAVYEKAGRDRLDNAKLLAGITAKLRRELKRGAGQ